MSVKLRNGFCADFVLLNLVICTYLTNTESVCNMSSIIAAHKEPFKEYQSIFSLYVPNKSCFICVMPSCDFNSPNCNRTLEFKDFPYYNHIIEFGLFGTDLPDGGFIHIPINNKCFLKVELLIVVSNSSSEEYPEDETYSFEVNFHQCKFSNNECFAVDRSLSQNLDFKTTCIFIGVAMKTLQEIYAGVSDECILIASALRRNSYRILIEEEDCFFDASLPIPNVTMTFFHSTRQSHEALTLIVPCSPGGYPVNPISGRLVTDSYCRSLYRSTCEGSNIDLIVSGVFESNENLLFPQKTVSYTNESENFLPIFLDANGKPKSIAEMRAKVVPDLNIKIVGREQCFLNVQNGSDVIQYAPEEWIEDYQRLDLAEGILELHELYGKGIHKTVKTTELSVTPATGNLSESTDYFENGASLRHFSFCEGFYMGIIIYCNFGISVFLRFL